MVQYEVALVVRAVSKQDLSKLLRGVCRTVLDENGVLRKLENLGVREIPHKMRVHNEQFELGRYGSLMMCAFVIPIIICVISAGIW